MKMSRLIFFAQPSNIEWAVTKLNATLHLFSQEDGLPQIESVLLVHDVSLSANIIEEYSKSINKINYNIELDELIIPALSDFSGWDGGYGLRHNDWIVLPPPGILFGKILHEVANSFDFRDGNIGFCHPSPDGETNTMYALVKTTPGLASLPEIKMKKVPLKMERTQTLNITLEKSSNGNFKTVQRVSSIPKDLQRAIEIEIQGTFAESKKFIKERIDSNFGLGFEKVTESLLRTNQDLTEIYHSVHFGVDDRDAQEEDFFVMTKSRNIIWISCKFIGGSKGLENLKTEVSRLQLKPPLNFPKQRIYSIVATSRSLAEKYASEPLEEKIPDVHVCHVGNLNEQISRISNGE